MTATISSTIQLAPMNPMDLYDGKNISTHFVLIDPDIALHWLGEYLDTSKNRPINSARVARYIEDMRAGRWKLTHQGVGISDGGVLVDGQHRLHAIMESGTAVVMAVTVGVDEDSFTAIDTGGVRTAADLAHVAGHPKYRTLTPAITRMVYFHRNDYYDVPAPANKAFTQAAVLEFAAELDWDKLVAAAEAVQTAPKGFSRTALGAFYYLAVYDRKIDSEIVEESFFRPIFTGFGFTEERDPRLVLRNRMIRDPFSTARKRQELLGGITRAWNNHLQGASIRSLVMPTTMPEIDLPSPGFLGRFYTAQAQA